MPTARWPTSSIASLLPNPSALSFFLMAMMPAREPLAQLYSRPARKLLVDDGARQAIEKHGKSLLPIGVTIVEGSFGKGDVVAICDKDGIEFARGLTNYSSTDAERLRGLNSEQITRVVGKLPYVELVHRDNLVVVA
jgi:glutamate 5-kinase